PSEPPGELLRGLRLTAHADFERLQAPDEEVAGVGRGDDAAARAELTESVGVLRALADDRSEQRVVVPGEVLRRAVEDDVCAEIARPEVVGGGGCRVYGDGA